MDLAAWNQRFTALHQTPEIAAPVPCRGAGPANFAPTAGPDICEECDFCGKVDIEINSCRLRDCPYRVEIAA